MPRAAFLTDLPVAERSCQLEQTPQRAVLSDLVRSEQSRRVGNELDAGFVLLSGRSENVIEIPCCDRDRAGVVSLLSCDDSSVPRCSNEFRYRLKAQKQLRQMVGLREASLRGAAVCAIQQPGSDLGIP